MAIIKPWAMNALNGEPTYDSATLRRILGSLLSVGSSPLLARPGVLHADGFKITFSGETVSVAPGLGVVTTVNGSYVTGIDSAQQFALGARDETNARLDNIVLTVTDDALNRSADLALIQGTPAALPSPPGTPASSISVGVINVPRVGGGPPTLAVAPAFTAANGGIIAVPDYESRLKIAGPSPIYAHQMNSDTLWHKNGAGQWKRMSSQGPIYARANHTAGTSVTTGGSYKPVPLASILEQVGGFTLSAGEIVIPWPGIYQINARVTWSPSINPTSAGYLRVYKNGSSGLRATGTVNGANGGCVFRCNAGDTISMGAWQSSGSTVSIGTTVEQTGMDIVCVSEGP